MEAKSLKRKRDAEVLDPAIGSKSQSSKKSVVPKLPKLSTVTPALGETTKGGASKASSVAVEKKGGGVEVGGVGGGSVKVVKGSDFSIDAIFSDMKAKKEKAKLAKASAIEHDRSKKEAEAAVEEELAALEKVERASNRIKETDSPVPVRIDKESGFPVYTVDQLKIGHGKGDTALCPFDCDCCY